MVAAVHRAGIKPGLAQQNATNPEGLMALG